MADATGWVPSNPFSANASAVPPAAVLQAMGISQWDPSQYAWDPVNGILTDRSNGSSLNFGNGGADPSLGTNVVSPDGSVQNFAQGTNPVFKDVGNAPPVGMSPADAYKWYADQKAGNQKDFLAAAAGLIGGPLLAGALSGAGGAGAAGNIGAAGGAGGGSAAGGAEAATTYALDPLTAGFGSTITGGELGGTGSSFLGSILGPAGGAAGGAGGLSSAAAGGVQGIDQGLSQGGQMSGPGLQDQNSIVDSLTSNLNGAAGSGLPGWLQTLLNNSGLIGAGAGLLDSALQPKSTTQTNNATNNSTSTSSLQLPSQITGPASDALTRAGQLLQTGQQFAPMPYVINHAADQLNSLGSNSAPTTSSFANGANINPYLDMEFNTAADATQNRLGSEFANAGQVNSPQHQGSRSQELQTLAAGIYGPGYESGLNRQYGAQEAGVQRGLTQSDSNLNRQIVGASAALPIGQYMQQQQQAQLNGPTNSLNSYIGQLGGLSSYFPGTSTQSQAGAQTGNYTQPLYNNPVLSAVGGAQLGSYLGGLLGQPQQPQQQGQNMQIQPFGSMPAYSYL